LGGRLPGDRGHRRHRLRAQAVAGRDDLVDRDADRRADDHAQDLRADLLARLARTPSVTVPSAPAGPKSVSPVARPHTFASTSASASAASVTSGLMPK